MIASLQHTLSKQKYPLISLNGISGGDDVGLSRSELAATATATLRHLVRCIAQVTLNPLPNPRVTLGAEAKRVGVLKA